MLDHSDFFRHNPKMQPDTLSAILSMVEARAVYAGGFSAGGRWAIRFPAPSMVKIFAIARGQCLVTVDGIDQSFQLNEGDTFLLSADEPFVLASDAALEPAEAHDIFKGQRSRIIPIGGEEDFLFLGSSLDLSSASCQLLLDSLPPTIHLRAEEAGADQLRWLIAELLWEVKADTPGVDVACSGLAQLIFLHVLRGYLAQRSDVEAGWLRAACDPNLAPALRLMHGEPARSWRLPELAKAAAMSRTSFAARFKAASGMAPLTYLTEWRMRLAERMLHDGLQPVSSIARSIGYASEAAFSTAFKRVMRRSPRRNASM